MVRVREGENSSNHFLCLHLLCRVGEMPPQLPPFGLPSYTFCHPSIPSSFCPSPYPLQLSTLPFKPFVLTPPLLPVISLYLLPLHLLRFRGGTKFPFRIDAKFFSFSFNGGRYDSYAIHESSWHVKHTIWLGRKGLEWILSCFADIRDWVPKKVSICKRF